MAEINNRIDGKSDLKLKGILDEFFPYIGAKDRRNEAIYRIDEHFSQLFPQPLDEKELREKIERILDELLFSPSENEGGSYELSRCIDQILALLQPKIEEAKREERERIKSWLRVNGGVAFAEALKGGE